MAEWLSDEEMAAWQPFVSAVTSLLTVIDDELLAAHGIHNLDYGILANLNASPDRSLRMSELARRFGVDASVITYRVDRLARRGIVERIKCPTDRRGVLAHLTGAGQELLEEAAPSHVATVRREFIDHLTPTDLQDLARCFRKVRRHQIGDDDLTERL